MLPSSFLEGGPTNLRYCLLACSYGWEVDHGTISTEVSCLHQAGSGPGPRKAVSCKESERTRPGSLTQPAWTVVRHMVLLASLAVPSNGEARPVRHLRPQGRDIHMDKWLPAKRGGIGALVFIKSEGAAAVQARLKMRRNPKVVEQLERWWSVALHNYYTFPRKFGFAPDIPRGVVGLNYEQYVDMFLRLHKALIKPFDEGVARGIVAMDWVLDTGSAAADHHERFGDGNILGREKLMDSMFALADTWCMGTTVEEHCAYLSLLIESVADEVIPGESALMLKPLKAIKQRDIGMEANARAPVDKWMQRAKDRAAARAAARLAAQQQPVEEFGAAELVEFTADVQATLAPPQPVRLANTESSPATRQRRGGVQHEIVPTSETKRRALAASMRSQSPRLEVNPSPSSPNVGTPAFSASEVTSLAAPPPSPSVAEAASITPLSVAEEQAKGEGEAPPDRRKGWPRRLTASLVAIAETPQAPLQTPPVDDILPRVSTPSISDHPTYWQGNFSSWEANSVAFSVSARREASARAAGKLDDVEGSFVPFRTPGRPGRPPSSPHNSRTPRPSSDPVMQRMRQLMHDPLSPVSVEPSALASSQPRRAVSTPSSPRAVPAYPTARVHVPSSQFHLQNTRRGITAGNAWHPSRASPNLPAASTPMSATVSHAAMHHTVSALKISALV